MLRRRCQRRSPADSDAVSLLALTAAQHHGLLHDVGGALHVDTHRLDQFGMLGGASRFDNFFDTFEQPVQR